MDRLKKLNGILPLFKPSGITSADALEQLKKELQRLAGLKKPLNHKQLSKLLKVGHGGTLDPMATGVLVVGLGSGCKQLQECLSGGKGYRLKARFGAHYDTYDSTGKVLEEKAFDNVNEALLRAAMKKFTGEIMQRPPAFSAVHVQGKRAYELARSGESVELPAKPVRIDSFELVSYSAEGGDWEAEVMCGGGTYIRSLIVDVAAALGTVAYMTELTRTQQGPFTLEHCLKLNALDLEVIEKSLK